MTAPFSSVAASVSRSRYWLTVIPSARIRESTGHGLLQLRRTAHPLSALEPAPAVSLQRLLIGYGSSTYGTITGALSTVTETWLLWPELADTARGRGRGRGRVGSGSSSTPIGGGSRTGISSLGAPTAPKNRERRRRKRIVGAPPAPKNGAYGVPMSPLHYGIAQRSPPFHGLIGRSGAPHLDSNTGRQLTTEVRFSPLGRCGSPPRKEDLGVVQKPGCEVDREEPYRS
jgi:hypothetical protein